jgi:phenylpyruvate tautomerase PptA (4-oxalocrotonate tautomerase family)
MPIATIEIRRKCSAAEEAAIVDAVHAALVAALKVPPEDRTVRLVVHEPHRFAVDPDKGDRFTLVSIDLFAGRSLQAKRALYAALADNLGALGIPADHVKVLLREVTRENWGIRGIPASEVDLGFEINV